MLYQGDNMNKIINIMSEHNIVYNWGTIYVAYSLKFITIQEIENFAIDYLDYRNISNEINEIICGVNRLEMQMLLKIILSKTLQIYDENLEKRKLRLAVLLFIEQKYKEQSLLKKIEEVYTIFDYPTEMESLVYYMPYENNDNRLSGQERIIEDFKKFISSEKKAISNFDNY